MSFARVTQQQLLCPELQVGSVGPGAIQLDGQDTASLLRLYQIQHLIRLYAIIGESTLIAEALTRHLRHHAVQQD